MPEESGHVPDAASARKVAADTWQLLYDIDVTTCAMRYGVKLKDDIWKVEASPMAVTVTPKRSGTPIAAKRKLVPPRPIGTFTAEIARANGRVLSTTHTR